MVEGARAEVQKRRANARPRIAAYATNSHRNEILIASARCRAPDSRGNGCLACGHGVAFRYTATGSEPFFRMLRLLNHRK